MLTGVTGHVGAHLLVELVTRFPSATVYCLIRARTTASVAQRLDDTIAFFELSLPAPARQRVRPLHGDLEKPQLGWSDDKWQWACENFDLIVHNGAIVNAVLPYESLRAANVNGTRWVLRLCGTHHVKPLLFVSTLSVLDAEPQRAADAPLASWLAAALTGYPLSKFVAERMIQQAAARIPAIVIRLG